MTALGITAALLVASLTINVVLTFIASRWLQCSGATWLRACAVVVLIALFSTAVLVFQYKFDDDFAGFFVSIGLTLLVYAQAYQTTGKQLLGFVALQVLLAIVGFGGAWTMKLTLCEAFQIPTNSMAPTVSGERIEGTCRQCGKLVIASPPDTERFARPAHCTHCFQEHDRSGTRKSGDRILVEKLRFPERWDLAVFRNPAEPDQNYLKRLVGLPGETITIRDGFLYAGDVKLEPPTAFSDLRYTSRPGDYDPVVGRQYEHDPALGDVRRPITMGADEYFFLGDNTHGAMDGRFFGPVKREAIIGTATVIYWPPERWRVFK